MSRFDGKVALISGAARGQGRAHAVAFAREGASLALFDVCKTMPSTPYEGPTASDLDETVRLCEAEGASVVAGQADVRNYMELKGFADDATNRFGKVDIVVANAGIFGIGPIADMDADVFAEVIDVNLKGVFNTIRSVLPGMVERGYGRVIATGSIASEMGLPGIGHYVASKHGVAGLIKSISREVGGNGVTANYVIPNGVKTPMIRHETAWRLLSPDEPTEEASNRVLAGMNSIPQPWVEPEDVSRIVLFLASDDARYTNGAAMKIDLGATA
jgi:SDR family mycofactocin-dependent oxidoreductase